MAARDPGPSVDQIDGMPVAELRELLDHPDPRLRADAACALGDRLRVGELPHLDAEHEARLVALLEESLPIVRLEAAITLAEAKNPRSIPILLAALRRRDFRLDATRALAASGSPEAHGPLAELMSRWLLPWADRLQAAAALCALGDRRGQDCLVAKLASRKAAERAAAIHFLGEAHHPAGLQELSALLERPDEPQRDVAARALGLLGDVAALPLLQRVRDSSDGDLRHDLDEAIARLSGASS